MPRRGVVRTSRQFQTTSNLDLNAHILDFQVKPRKPVTVNWRDIRKTIDSSSAVAGAKTGPVPDDPLKDPLAWLDDGLPDLSSSNFQHFDLALQFDIGRYASLQKHTGKGQKSASASVMAPAESDWDTW